MPKPSKPNRPPNHQKFIDFLKERNLLFPFILYRARHCKDWEDRTGTLSEHLSQQLPDRYLLNAFSWNNTIEGHRFWNMINKEWLISLS